MVPSASIKKMFGKNLLSFFGKLLKKIKTKFFVMEKKQIQSVNYFETYATVVAYLTVEMLPCFILKYGQFIRYVDFRNAFVHQLL